MGESFGARLRTQRERQHIDLSTIAAQTKVNVAFFEALERDDVSRWPSGIFRRSFLRAYAHAIGLDPDPVIKEFLERFPDPAEVSIADPVSALASTVAKRERAERPAVDMAAPSTPSPTPFVRWSVLPGMDHRLRAVAWDAGVLIAIALSGVVVADRFWAPLAIATLAYYFGAILVLGNTPGVYFFAAEAARPRSESFITKTRRPRRAPDRMIKSVRDLRVLRAFVKRDEEPRSRPRRGSLGRPTR